MADTHAQQEVESITWEATVIRKDGTREDLGVIAEYNRSDSTKNKGSVMFGDSIKKLLRIDS